MDKTKKIGVIFEGEEKELELKDVVLMLLQKAEEVAGNIVLRHYHSALRRAMIDVTNEVLEGMRAWGVKQGDQPHALDYGYLRRSLPWGDEMEAARDHMIEMLDGSMADDEVRVYLRTYCQTQYGVTL